MTRKILTAVVAALLAGLAFTMLGFERAEACGGFFPATQSEQRRPSLAYEQVLIVYDQKQQREHFLREVVFRRAREPFGFVIPTPSRPEVAAVAKSPFTELRRRFGFGSAPVPGARAEGVGYGRLGGGASEGVTLVEVKKVGSFTAFVLTATDEKGLSSWLAEQKLVKTPEAGAWLGHYVRLGFFFVAMRYEPTPAAPGGKPDDGASSKAETMRLSFSTPLPYYPYFEPERPSAPGEARLLDLWVVSDGVFEPVTLLERDGARHWVRPFRAGNRYEHARTTLGSSLAPDLSALLPEGPLTVTTYQDQKVSRRGFGDVLFVAERSTPANAERNAELRKFLSVLDPELDP